MSTGGMNVLQIILLRNERSVAVVLFVVECILFFSVSVGGLLLWSYMQANFSSTCLESVLIFEAHSEIACCYYQIWGFEEGGRSFPSSSSVTNPLSLQSANQKNKLKSCYSWTEICAYLEALPCTVS